MASPATGTSDPRTDFARSNIGIFPCSPLYPLWGDCRLCPYGHHNQNQLSGECRFSRRLRHPWTLTSRDFKVGISFVIVSTATNSSRSPTPRSRDTHHLICPYFAEPFLPVYGNCFTINCPSHVCLYLHCRAASTSRIRRSSWLLALQFGIERNWLWGYHLVYGDVTLHSSSKVSQFSSIELESRV